MKNMKSILSIALALVLCMALFTGCGAAANPGSGTALATGGVLCLKVNPEIAVHYDADGNVTSVESRNADADTILAAYTGFEGKAARDVVAELVTLIGEAGYFVEEIEGQRRQITIEIEPGSSLPSATFLTDVADEVRTTVSANDWTTPVDLQGTTDYGMTDYVDTDYGPNNDGVTDYTDYAATVPATQPTAGYTDYDDTDYGPNNDGVTDYNDTDYGPNNDGVTDYTDYAAAATVPATQPTAGYTDYDDTDYGPNNDGVTDYDATDYYTGSHHSDYGESHHADGHH